MATLACAGVKPSNAQARVHATAVVQSRTTSETQHHNLVSQQLPAYCPLLPTPTAGTIAMRRKSRPLRWRWWLSLARWWWRRLSLGHRATTTATAATITTRRHSSRGGLRLLLYGLVSRCLPSGSPSSLRLRRRRRWWGWLWSRSWVSTAAAATAGATKHVACTGAGRSACTMARPVEAGTRRGCTGCRTRGIHRSRCRGTSTSTSASASASASIWTCTCASVRRAGRCRHPTQRQEPRVASVLCSCGANGVFVEE